jgi:hypothetical protein
MIWKREKRMRMGASSGVDSIASSRYGFLLPLMQGMEHADGAANPEHL